MAPAKRLPKIEGSYVEQRDDGEETFFAVHFVCNSPDKLTNSVRVCLAPGQTLQANFLDWKDQQKHWADPIVLKNQLAVVASLDVVVKSLLYLGTDDPDAQMGCHVGDAEALIAATEREASIPVVHFVGLKISPIDHLAPPTRENGAQLKI